MPQEQLADFYQDHWPPPPNSEKGYDASAWKSYSSAKRQAILKLVGRRSTRPLKDLNALAHILAGRMGDDRPAGYAAAEAWAEIVARENRVKTLPRDLGAYLESNSLTNYSSTGNWGVLLAFVYALERIGGRENLPALEEIMKSNPGAVQAAHEQAFFSAPYSWAKTVVRNGLFAEFSQPRRGEDGSPNPSKIEEMLASHNPMFAAAALYAVALSQSQLTAEPPSTAAAQEPAAYPPFPESKQSSSGYGYHGM